MNVKSTDTQQHLLNTAKKIMANKGFSAVGLNEILKTAGIPKGSFYHYFDCKESFGGALLHNYFSDYLENIRRLLKRKDLCAADRLLMYATHWMETQACGESDEKCLAVKLGAEVSDLSEVMRTTLENGIQKVINLIAECIEEGINTGEFTNNTHSQHAAIAFYQLWLGASLLAKITKDCQPLEIAMVSTSQILLALSAPK